MILIFALRDLHRFVHKRYCLLENCYEEFGNIWIGFRFADVYGFTERTMPNTRNCNILNNIGLLDCISNFPAPHR